MAGMGISQVSFGNGIVSRDPRNPMEKAKDRWEKRQVAIQEMRRKELENKKKSDEGLSSAEELELKTIYMERAMDWLANLGKSTVVYAA